MSEAAVPVEENTHCVENNPCPPREGDYVVGKDSPMKTEIEFYLPEARRPVDPPTYQDVYNAGGLIVLDGILYKLVDDGSGWELYALGLGPCGRSWSGKHFLQDPIFPGGGSVGYDWFIPTKVTITVERG